MSDGTWTTSAEVCNAAGEIHTRTAHRWVAWGLLPQPMRVPIGRRGSVHWWPKITVAQARWVRARFDSGMLKEQVRAALERGDFERSVLGDRARGC